MTRMEAIADAVLADWRAIISLGSAMLHRTPMTPHTNKRSMSAKPWSFRIVNGSALAPPDCSSYAALIDPGKLLLLRYLANLREAEPDVLRQYGTQRDKSWQR